MNYMLISEDELYHHGVLGMKWGVRRYQKYGEGGYNPKHKGEYKPSKKTSLKEAVAKAEANRKEKVRNRKLAMRQYGRLEDAKIYSKDDIADTYSRLEDALVYSKSASEPIKKANSFIEKAMELADKTNVDTDKINELIEQAMRALDDID